MRLTDRLNLPQRIVVVVALGLALGEVGNFLVIGLWSAPRFSWITYGPSTPTAFATSAVLPAWAHPLIWLAFIILWALLSIRILHPSKETAPDEGQASARSSSARRA